MGGGYLQGWQGTGTCLHNHLHWSLDNLHPFLVGIREDWLVNSGPLLWQEGAGICKHQIRESTMLDFTSHLCLVHPK
jgi:hypothetical protein